MPTTPVSVLRQPLAPQKAHAISAYKQQRGVLPCVAQEHGVGRVVCTHHGRFALFFGTTVQPVQPVSVPGESLWDAAVRDGLALTLHRSTIGAFYVPPPNTDWVHKEKERRAKVAAHVLLKGKDDLLALESNVVKADDIREIVVETFDVRDAIIELAEIEKVDAIVCGSRG